MGNTYTPRSVLPVTVQEATDLPPPNSPQPENIPSADPFIQDPQRFNSPADNMSIGYESRMKFFEKQPVDILNPNVFLFTVALMWTIGHAVLSLVSDEVEWFMKAILVSFVVVFGSLLSVPLLCQLAVGGNPLTDPDAFKFLARAEYLQMSPWGGIEYFLLKTAGDLVCGVGLKALSTFCKTGLTDSRIQLLLGVYVCYLCYLNIYYRRGFLSHYLTICTFLYNNFNMAIGEGRMVFVIVIGSVMLLLVSDLFLTLKEPINRPIAVDYVKFISLPEEGRLCGANQPPHRISAEVLANFRHYQQARRG